jgi:uncharacterized membrane protein (DUF2068 family)
MAMIVTELTSPRPRTLSLIIAYKLARAGVAALGAVGAVVLIASGQALPLQHALELMRDHAVSGLALTVSQVLVLASRADHLRLLALVLAVDAGLLVVEGWALARGKWWGPWLVVGVSSALVPFEVVALISEPSIVRVTVMLFNLAIVAWLVTHAVRSGARAQSRVLPASAMASASHCRAALKSPL